jgi:Excalibur calcium-binding domain
MRRRTTAAAGALITAALSLGLSGTAHAAVDRDCPDFASQAEAQAAFDAVPGDPKRLDANNNGIACENYDYASASSTASSSQVSTRPSGSVAAGDGSSTEEASTLPYVLGGVALVGAGGAAFAARRSSRSAA